MQSAAAELPTVPGIERLSGCPAEAHVRWMMATRAPGAPPVDAEAFQQHVAAEPHLAEFASTFSFAQSQGPNAVTEVTGYRRGSSLAIIVEYVGADGHDWEFGFDVAPDGRLEAPHLQRALGGIEVRACHPDDLSDVDRVALFDVFDATYEAADHQYLADQLERFGCVGFAVDEGRVVGFTVADLRQLDLPAVGPQACHRSGLSCVLAEVRRRGLMTSVASAAARHSIMESGVFGFSLVAARLASPATLTPQLKGHEGRAWPPVDDPFALYDHPTPTQVAVARAVAEAFGATGYDEATGACIGSGTPIGTPLVEPEADPGVAARFDRLDRGRGDSLLWLSWIAPPPDAWFA